LFPELYWLQYSTVRGTGSDLVPAEGALEAAVPLQAASRALVAPIPSSARRLVFMVRLSIVPA
jgi:hypothetical protein